MILNFVVGVWIGARGIQVVDQLMVGHECQFLKDHPNGRIFLVYGKDSGGEWTEDGPRSTGSSVSQRTMTSAKVVDDTGLVKWTCAREAESKPKEFR